MADAENKQTTEQVEIEKKTLTVDGYSFDVDLDLLDDADAFKLINKIENENQITAVVPLMDYLIGEKAFKQMKAYFTEKDAEANKGKKNYHPRLRIGKLGEIYQEIIKNFDPKD